MRTLRFRLLGLAVLGLLCLLPHTTFAASAGSPEPTVVVPPDGDCNPDVVGVLDGEGGINFDGDLGACFAGCSISLSNAGVGANCSCSASGKGATCKPNGKTGNNRTVTCTDAAGAITCSYSNNGASCSCS